jgi:prepilin-type N-terminal cleavage/methylation domain-containing protein
MKAERIKGFTLVELLTALAIVAILIGLLMPALGQVRKYAGNVKQKVQINSIEIGLSSYKNDFGQYPRSNGYGMTDADVDPNKYDYQYSGVQTLAEAMFGQDLMGFNPNSVYKYTGLNSNDTNDCYPPNPSKANIDRRKGPYLDKTSIGVFGPNDVFTQTELSNNTIRKYGYMICDTFTTQSKKINGKTYKIGAPILYFRANPSAPRTQQFIATASSDEIVKNIYNYRDDYLFLKAAYNHNIKNNKFYDATLTEEIINRFFGFISDPIIPAATGTYGRPVHPDSYILISAGSDGIYGTKDDICNFEPNSVQ